MIYIFFNFGRGFFDSFPMLFPETPVSYHKKFWNTFCYSKSVLQIFKIFFQTGNINIFVLRGVFFDRYVQLKSPFSEKKKIPTVEESVYLKCHNIFLINWNTKLEIKFWFSFQYLSWDMKHQTKWFFDFQNNWALKFKFEFRFPFFILICKTKNQINLNKYFMKLVTIALTQSQ